MFSINQSISWQISQSISSPAGNLLPNHALQIASTCSFKHLWLKGNPWVATSCAYSIMRSISCIELTEWFPSIYQIAECDIVEFDIFPSLNSPVSCNLLTDCLKALLSFRTLLYLFSFICNNCLSHGMIVLLLADLGFFSCRFCSSNHSWVVGWPDHSVMKFVCSRCSRTNKILCRSNAETTRLIFTSVVIPV